MTDQKTLRDEFAMAAMRCVPPMNAYNMRSNEHPDAYLARNAYDMADAMMAEREARAQGEK